MELEIKLTLRIELNDENCGDPEKNDPLESRLLKSAREAVQNSLRMGEENGFSHDLADISSLSVLEVGESIRV